MITTTKTKNLFAGKCFISNNKVLLLKMARAGQSRPHYKTNLYIYLCRCTNKKDTLYDSFFAKLIRKLRPDWFETRMEVTTKIKNLLINFAKSGKQRPIHGTKLYTNFVSYTCKNSKAYDKKFVDLIIKYRPDWLYTRTQKANNKKQQIICLAKKGLNKPKRTDILGIALKNYTNKSSCVYDPVFTKFIKELRPDWFIK